MEQRQDLSDRNGHGPGATAQFCSGCGKQFKDEQAFCSGCGHPRPAATLPREPEPAPAPTTALVSTVTLAPAPPLKPAAAEPAPVPPAPAPEPARRSRRRPLIAAAAVAVAVALVGGGVVVLTGGGKGYDINSSAARADESLRTVADKLAKAETVAAIRTVGASAKESQAEVAREISSLGKVSDPARRSSAREAFEAEGTLLEAWNGLSALADGAPDSWTAAAAPIAAATDAWEKARDRLTTNGVDALDPAVRKSVTEAGKDVTGYLTDSAAKLTGAKAGADRVMADKATGLAALDTYSKAAHQQIDTYLGLRKDLSGTISQIEAGSTTYSAAFRALSDASDKRVGVRNALDALSPPAAVVPAHHALEALVDKSVSAVDSAYSGLRDYQTYSYYYSSVTSTPDWQSFQSDSDDITAAWAPAVAAWDKALTDERNRLNGITAPALPIF